MAPVAWLVLLLTVGAVAAMPIAELPSGSFEGEAAEAPPTWVSSDNPAAEGPAPHGWASWHSPRTKAEFAWDTRRARSGERLLYPRNHGPRTEVWMTEIPVVPRAEYRIRVYGWAEQNRGRTQITERARDAEGQ